MKYFALILAVLVLAALYSHSQRPKKIRYKVAEVNADLRSVATALAHYEIEAKAFPPSAPMDVIVHEGPGGHASKQALNLLSAPKSYIRSIPADRFAKNKEQTIGYYHFDPNIDSALHEKGYAYIIWSVGPDRVSNVRSFEDATGEMLGNMIYDATNGHLSSGDIIRSNKGDWRYGFPNLKE